MKKPIRLNSTLLMTLGNVIGMTNTVIMERTGLKNATFYTLQKDPANISVQQLLQFSNGLHIPVSRFFTTDACDPVGHPDEYVINPFLPCRYDGETMRHLVNDQHIGSWTDAFRLTGITRGHIRKSLTSATRLPVARFLTVCDGFGIDPFTILIDPNPSLGNRKVTQSATVATSGLLDRNLGTDLSVLRREVTRLRSDLATVRRDLADMHKKYQSLLRDHEALAHRVSVNIENFTDSHLSIAAESPSIPYGKKQ